MFTIDTIKTSLCRVPHLLLIGGKRVVVKGGV